MPLTITKPEDEKPHRGAGTQSTPDGDDGPAQSQTPSGSEKTIVPSNLRRRLASSLLRSLVAVLIGSLVLRLASQTMGQMLQFYFEEIDQNHYSLSYTVRGFIIASFFITEMLGSPVLGAMSDRYGRRLFILLGPIFGAIGVQITSMTVAIWLLVFTRLLEGLSTASAIPATLSYISEATTGRPNLRARIIGLFEITLVGGLVLGGVVGGYLWYYFGTPMTVLGMRLISPAFSINGLIYMVSLAIFAWGLKDLKRKRRASAEQVKKNHYREVLKSPRVWMFVPAWLAVFSIVGMWSNHSAGLLTGTGSHPDQLLMGNMATKEFGNGFGALGLVFSLGLLGWSFYLGQFRKTSVMLIATGGLFTTMVIVYGLNHMGSFSSPAHYPLLAALVIALVITSGFTPAALTYLADVTEAHAEDRGSIMGLYSVFLGVGQVIGTTLGGLFATWFGLDGLLLLSAIFAVITALTLVTLRKQEAALKALKAD